MKVTSAYLGLFIGGERNARIPVATHGLSLSGKKKAYENHERPTSRHQPIRHQYIQEMISLGRQRESFRVDKQFETERSSSIKCNDTTD